MKAAISLVAAWCVLSVMTGWSAANAQIGSRLENIELASIDGAKHFLLSNATANVFIFFRPGQEFSKTTLTHLAVCQKEMTTNSVHWVAVVSDRYPKNEVEALVKETGISMPVLIDAGDALYAKLRLALCPVVGIADQDHKLVACEYFTKVNFTEVVAGRIRFLLKEIDKAQLDRILNPPTAGTHGDDADLAHRRLMLAEKLLKAKSYEKALENVNKSIEKDSKSAAAYVLKGRIYSAQGNKDEARKAFGEALRIEPGNTNAIAGMKASE